MHDTAHNASTTPPAKTRLSYKYQRLRERLRQAILNGELSGKLPGERQLADRFNANAKTLSKALTDLAAEGLLERTIGRGTFVRGADRPSARRDKWLLVCDPSREQTALPRLLKEACPDAQLVTSVADLRPSFLGQFTAVVDLATHTPDSFLRDMLVRSGLVVLVGREPQGYSMHAVLPDLALGAACAARELMIAGHRNITAVEPCDGGAIEQALRTSARRFGCDATIQRCHDDELEAAVEQGCTAFVCDATCAQRVMQALRRLGLSSPGPVSVMAVGCVENAYPCSGFFVTPVQMCDAIVALLRETSRRPQTLWLAGERIDQQTVAPVLTALDAEPTLALPQAIL